MQTINLQKIFDKTTYSLNSDINILVTNLNIKIFQTINQILKGTFCIKNYIVLLYKMFEINKITNKKINKFFNPLQTIEELSNDLYNEVISKPRPIESLCYLIGTNSELPNNYTILTRISIITTIMKFMNVNLIFN